MPALQGQIVNSSAETERFLRDWRRTLGQLVVENLYDQMTDILDTYHMGRYTESHENGRVYLTDGMDVKRRSSVPMAAAWMPNETGASTPAMSQADIRESASVAHIYGQNIVAGESLTAPGGPGKSYAYHPANMKFIADMEMYSGLNRFVIHTSVHQPVDDKIPGLGLGPIGQWFNRHENWAESAWAWMDYLGRSSYMLQQGHYVADVVYYYGEDNCITGLYGEQLPDVPAGYSYDFINSDALLNLLQAQDGRLTTPSGMSYRVLALGDNARTLPLPVLRKIAQLAQQGVTICGVKPERCGSLTDDEQEFYDLVQQIWGGGMHNVLVGASVAQALQQQGIAPDVELKDGLRFVHRNSKDTDIYWVNNPQGEARTVELSFRTSGKKPEVWHPEDGRREEVSYSIKDGRTTVTLNLAEDDAVFVVFSGKAKQQEMKLPALQSQTLLTLNNDWNVRFQEHRGAPESMTMEQLADLSQTTEPGVKYFSGVASYSKRFSLDQEQLNGQQLFIDLGQVGVMAEVTLNGQPVGLVWKTPFRVDATKAAKAGENLLEVKVTNLWINRLIGDSTLPEAERISWTPYPFYNASVPLSPSGLMGPVQVVAVK